MDALEQRQWLERVRNVQDRRVINLKLTESGREIEQRCQLLARRYWTAVLTDWDEADVGKLMTLMTKLRSSMELVAFGELPLLD